jgi:hypothetical protein
MTTQDTPAPELDALTALGRNIIDHYIVTHPAPTDPEEVQPDVPDQAAQLVSASLNGK